MNNRKNNGEPKQRKNEDLGFITEKLEKYNDPESKLNKEFVPRGKKSKRKLRENPLIVDVTKIPKIEELKQNVEVLGGERLFDLVKKFSYPRRVGSDGEKQVIRETIKEFRSHGSAPKKENFEFTLFYSIWFIRVLLIAEDLYLLALILFYDAIPFQIWGLIFLGLALLIVLYSLFPNKFKIGHKQISSNVIVKKKAKNPAPSPVAVNIIISAHTDSKSQRFTTLHRVKVFKRNLITVGIAFGILLSALLLRVFSDFPIHVYYFLWPLFLSLVGLNVTHLLNSHGNESIGALDNASGMAVVFGLAEYFLTHPVEHLNLWFCQFGAEEYGQMGARDYVNRHSDKFDEDHTFNFNIDMIGEKQDTRVNLTQFSPKGKKGRSSLRLTKIVKDVGKTLDHNLTVFKFPVAARTDRMVFANKNYHTAEFLSPASTLWTHTHEDTPDKIDPAVLEKVSKIIVGSIFALDFYYSDPENYHIEDEDLVD